MVVNYRIFTHDKILGGLKHLRVGDCLKIEITQEDTLIRIYDSGSVCKGILKVEIYPNWMEKVRVIPSMLMRVLDDNFKINVTREAAPMVWYRNKEEGVLTAKVPYESEWWTEKRRGVVKVNIGKSRQVGNFTL